MVGLCALERLTGVDDQCAGEHHLGQAKDGTKDKALEDDQLKIAELELLAIEVIQQTYQGANGDDGCDADLITTVMLYQERYEHAQRKESEAEGGHRNARLYG